VSYLFSNYLRIQFSEVSLNTRKVRIPSSAVTIMSIPDFDILLGEDMAEEFELHGGGVDYVGDDDLALVLETIDWGAIGMVEEAPDIPVTPVNPQPAPQPPVEPAVLHCVDGVLKWSTHG